MMDSAQLRLQLARIHDLQAELQRVVRDDTLANLESRTAELGSRLDTVIAACSGEPALPDRYFVQLQRILAEQARLVLLVQHKLQVTGTQVAKAKASRAAVRRYQVEPARTELSLAPRTDISG